MVSVPQKVSILRSINLAAASFWAHTIIVNIYLIPPTCHILINFPIGRLGSKIYNVYWRFHHTLKASLHYLVKYLCRKIAIITNWRVMQTSLKTVVQSSCQNIHLVMLPLFGSLTRYSQYQHQTKLTKWSSVHLQQPMSLHTNDVQLFADGISWQENK